MNKMLKDTLILTLITICAGLILSFVFEITKEPIALQKEKASQEASMQVFKDATSFEKDETFTYDQQRKILDEAGYLNADIDGVQIALADGDQIGYVLTVVTHDGYSGDISYMMGVQMDGTLNAISLLTIAETPGLGMRAEEVIVPQLEDKKVEKFVSTKTGALSEDQVDGISGATITTDAVIDGVNAGLAYFHATVEGGTFQ